VRDTKKPRKGRGFVNFAQNAIGKKREANFGLRWRQQATCFLSSRASKEKGEREEQLCARFRRDGGSMQLIAETPHKYN